MFCIFANSECIDNSNYDKNSKRFIEAFCKILNNASTYNGVKSINNFKSSVHKDIEIKFKANQNNIFLTAFIPKYNFLYQNVNIEINSKEVKYKTSTGFSKSESLNDDQLKLLKLVCESSWNFEKVKLIFSSIKTKTYIEKEENKSFLSLTRYFNNDHLGKPKPKTKQEKYKNRITITISFNQDFSKFKRIDFRGPDFNYTLIFEN